MKFYQRYYLRERRPLRRLLQRLGPAGKINPGVHGCRDLYKKHSRAALKRQRL